MTAGERSRVARKAARARWGVRLERGKCSACGRDVACRVPRGGDGSLTVAVHHTRWAPGAAAPDRCPGSGIETT